MAGKRSVSAGSPSLASTVGLAMGHPGNLGHEQDPLASQDLFYSLHWQLH